MPEEEKVTGHCRYHINEQPHDWCSVLSVIAVISAQPPPRFKVLSEICILQTTSGGGGGNFPAGSIKVSLLLLNFTRVRNRSYKALVFIGLVMLRPNTCSEHKGKADCFLQTPAYGTL